MPASITVLNTGGTIVSTPAENGATPSKSGEDLIAAVPELESYADIGVAEVVQTPSFDMDIESLTVIARRTRTAIDGGTDSVVITHVRTPWKSPPTIWTSFLTSMRQSSSWEPSAVRMR